MPPAGFEPTIPAGERPQTDALDRAASGIAACSLSCSDKLVLSFCVCLVRFRAETRKAKPMYLNILKPSGFFTYHQV
jgi:hypothetical protein